MAKDFYIFAGGGTGGHLYPAIAVAEQLKSVNPQAAIVFACSDRPIDMHILKSLPYPIVSQPVHPIPRRLSDLWPFMKGWMAANKIARNLIKDLRPKAVLGLGGFAAAPVVRQASKAGIPAGTLNPDAVPGVANRYLSGFADVIFTQFESSRSHFKPALRDKVRCTGCPVRASLISGDKAEAIKHFGLCDDRKTLLVFGASLGASTINQAIELLLNDLNAFADSWQVLHVTGERDKETGDRGFSIAPFSLHLIRLPYCHRMDLAYAAADLALCRAGASTIAELMATGTPAVLMPYPYHKDQHQRLNAEAVVAAGSGIIVNDEKNAAANAASLRKNLLPLLADESRPSGSGQQRFRYRFDRSLTLAVRSSADNKVVHSSAANIAAWLVNPRSIVN